MCQYDSETDSKVVVKNFVLIFLLYLHLESLEKQKTSSYTSEYWTSRRPVANSQKRRKHLPYVRLDRTVAVAKVRFAHSLCWRNTFAHLKSQNKYMWAISYVNLINSNLKRVWMIDSQWNNKRTRYSFL